MCICITHTVNFILLILNKYNEDDKVLVLCIVVNIGWSSEITGNTMNNYKITEPLRNRCV